MTTDKYVHGYSDRENTRLADQARTLTELLHHDTRYPPGSRVLEAGCGVGAQTAILAEASPQAHFTCVDISTESVEQARANARRLGLSNVSFRTADIFDLPFGENAFDHVFVCFVLEHLPRPGDALVRLKRHLKPGGTITVIEGDHGSAFFHPRSDAADAAIRCLVEIQRRMGGNALIGRELFPLLAGAGFRDVSVSPRVVYADASRPHMVEGFTKNTFNAMVGLAKEQALKLKLIDEATWDKGMTDLYRTAEQDGAFIYTFFKAAGVK